MPDPAPPSPVSAPHRVKPVALDTIGYGLHRDDYTVTDQLHRRALVRATLFVIVHE